MLPAPPARVAIRAANRTHVAGRAYTAAVPTVLRARGFRLYFYSHEPNEPPHVRADRGSSSAKLWLAPVELASNHGFRAHELTELHRLVSENQRNAAGGMA